MTFPTPELAAGFDDPVHGAQRCFRAVLAALARPGTVHALQGIGDAPPPLTPSLAAVALTLLDHGTPIGLCSSLRIPAVQNFLTFHTGAPLMDGAQSASFVLCASPNEMPALDELNPGTPDYPDSSSTLLLAVTGFEAGKVVTLTGPGIEREQSFQASGLDAEFWRSARRNSTRYPLGIDFLFCGADAVAGLPRSTKIKV